jgi:hypothetical protein
VFYSTHKDSRLHIPRVLCNSTSTFGTVRKNFNHAYSGSIPCCISWYRRFNSFFFKLGRNSMEKTLALDGNPTSPWHSISSPYRVTQPQRGSTLLGSLYNRWRFGYRGWNLIPGKRIFFCGRKSNFICRASKIRVTTQKTKEETLWWFKIISPQNWIVLHKFQTTNSPLKVHLQSLGGRADRAAPCLTSLGTAGYGKPITSPLSIRSIRSISTGFHVDWDTGGHALIFWLTSSVMWPSFGDGSKVNTDDVQDSGDEHDNNTMI